MIDQKLLGPIFSVVEKISKNVSDTIIGEAVNLRLGTQNLNLHQISVEAAKKGLTFEDVLAMK